MSAEQILEKLGVKFRNVSIKENYIVLKSFGKIKRSSENSKKFLRIF